MKALIAGWVFLCLGLLAHAGGLPWMGVSLHAAKPEESLGTEMSPGVGFEVSRVVAGGPVAEAGGRAGDLWWKVDGQILVNKGQMVVLLRTKKPGDRVEIDFYREGRLEQLSLVLGSRDHQRLVPVSFREEYRDEARILAKREKVARVQIQGSEVSLESEGDRFRFRVREDGLTILSALVTNLEIDETIPAKWHHAFMILRSTLESNSEPTLTEAKQRVRYLPRASSSEE